MLIFLGKRLIQALIALFILVTIVFFMFRLLPADPTAAMVDASLSPEAQMQIKASFGLDQPLYKQYFIYLKNIILHGDFGMSFFYRESVISVLASRILNTIILGTTAIIFAYSLGLILGALMAWYRGSLFEMSSIIVGLFFKAAPQFWTGMIFLMIFSYGLGWFPYSGIREAGYEASGIMKYFSMDFLHHLILPATVTGLYYLAQPMLLMRNAMLEITNEPFIELAFAKGLPERRIIFYHAARNALLPATTTLATKMGQLIGGIVLIEYVFSWPGLGREIVMAASRYDYPLAQASFLLIAFVVMFYNVLADLLYGFLDPRIVY